MNIGTVVDAACQGNLSVCHFGYPCRRLVSPGLGYVRGYTLSQQFASAFGYSGMLRRVDWKTVTVISEDHVFIFRVCSKRRVAGLLGMLDTENENTAVPSKCQEQLAQRHSVAFQKK